MGTIKEWIELPVFIVDEYGDENLGTKDIWGITMYMFRKKEIAYYSEIKYSDEDFLNGKAEISYRGEKMMTNVPYKQFKKIMVQ